MNTCDSKPERYIFLSHPLSNQTTGYGGSLDFDLEIKQSISKNNSCNQTSWKLSAHIGTHMDAPYHFHNDGKTVDQFFASNFIFSKVSLIDLKVNDDEIIYPNTWCNSISSDATLLLIRTGFEQLRGTKKYWNNNPGLSIELSEWLEINRPLVRAVGFDFISLTSYQHRPLGKVVHSKFLGQKDKSFIVIEDMSLKDLFQSPKEVIVAPLRVSGADGSPVTIFAKY